MSRPGVAGQEWSARRYAETAHFVPALGAPVLELLAPSAGERILDLGCGDGVLTKKIAAAGATVVAVDAAPEMVAAARARGIDARVMPGQNLTFDGEFDAVFSNAALHWMRPPEAVLAGVRRALRPGGRFVGEMGGHNNTAAIIVALSAVLARRGLDAHRLSPWYFPSAAAYRSKLEEAGFAVEDIRIVPRPTVLPTSIEPLAGHLRRSFFQGVAASGPITCARRGRGAAAADLDGRDGNLDCRLCPAPLPRNAARMSCYIDSIATLWYIVRSFTGRRSDICTPGCRWLALAGLDRVAARRKHHRLGPSLYFACISRRARARSRVWRAKKMKLDCFGRT